jgi:hypothetical protein
MGMFSLRDYTILNQLKVTAIDVVPAAKAKVAAAVVVKNVIVSLGMNKIRVLACGDERYLQCP